MRTPYRTNLERTGERPNRHVAYPLPNRRKNTQTKAAAQTAWEAVTCTCPLLYTYDLSELLTQRAPAAVSCEKCFYCILYLTWYSQCHIELIASYHFIETGTET
jgi:hypothetical protein